MANPETAVRRKVPNLKPSDFQRALEGWRQIEAEDSEPRVHSLCTFQRLSLRSRFAVLRGHLPPRFLCGSPCELLRCCV